MLHNINPCTILFENINVKTKQKKTWYTMAGDMEVEAEARTSAPTPRVEETAAPKSVLCIEYNSKIRENDFTNIDAFLVNECMVLQAPRVLQAPADLTATLRSMSETSIRVSEDKMNLLLPVLVFRETGTEHMVCHVSVRIDPSKKCVIGPTAQEKLPVLQFMTSEPPSSFRNTGYQVVMGRLKNSDSVVMIPESNPRKMEIVGMLPDLETVNSTRFGQHEALLPVDFVKKWREVEGGINKNPLIMNKLIFIMLFGRYTTRSPTRSVETSQIPNEVERLIRDLKRRLFETAQPVRPGARHRRRRRRSALTTFEDVEDPNEEEEEEEEFNVEEEYIEHAEEEDVDIQAWRACVGAVCGKNMERLVPMPPPMRGRLRHAHVSSPVDMVVVGRGKGTSSSSGKVMLESQRPRGKVGLYVTETSVVDVLTKLELDTESSTHLKYACTALVVAMACMCTQSSMRTIMKSVEKVGTCGGVLLHMHQAIRKMAAHQQGGLMELVITAISGPPPAPYPPPGQGNSAIHKIQILRRCIHLCTQGIQGDVPLGTCIRAAACATVQYCTAADFEEMYTTVESLDDLVDVVEEQQLKMYEDVDLSLLDRVEGWEQTPSNEEETVDLLESADGTMRAYATLLYTITTPAEFTHACHMGVVKEYLDKNIHTHSPKMQDLYAMLTTIEEKERTLFLEKRMIPAVPYYDNQENQDINIED